MIFLENDPMGLLAGVGGALPTALAVPIHYRLQTSLALQFYLPLALAVVFAPIVLAPLSAGLAGWESMRARLVVVSRTV